MICAVEDCKPFCDYGIEKEILVPTDIYENFTNSFGSIMTFAVMTGYEWRYNKMNANEHSVRLIKDENRAFTIHMLNAIDKYKSVFELTIYYHFHFDTPKHQMYKQMFDELYGGIFPREDNGVILQTKEQVIEGLQIFTKIIAKTT